MTEIKVFDVTDEGRHHVSLPSKRPGRCQLVFVEGDQQRVIEFPAHMRRDIGMALMSAGGERVRVSMTFPEVKTGQIDCPKCEAKAGERCLGVKKNRSSTYHPQRRKAARDETMRLQSRG